MHSSTRSGSRAWSSVAFAALAIAACSGDEGGVAPPSPSQPAALSLTIPDTITGSQPFSLTVRALTSAGVPDRNWRGSIALTASSGSVAPVSLAVTNGEATVQATLQNATGNITISATAGALAARDSAFVWSEQEPVRIEIAPATLLVPGAGTTATLVAHAFDAAGARTIASVTWVSSNPAVAQVGATGVVTGVSTGSAQIRAQRGTVSSRPALTVVARPAANAMLVTDAQITGSLVAVNPAAPYGPGFRYRARLASATPPAVGQILIGAGDKPLGGRVVSVTPAAGGAVDVELELRPLEEMVPEFRVNETISLVGLPIIPPEQAPQGDRSFQAGPDTVKVGRFECIYDVSTGDITNVTYLQFLTQNVTVNPTFMLDLQGSALTSFRMVARGDVTAAIDFKPRINSAFEGKVTCSIELGAVPLPIGGALAMFIGGEIPLQAGFGLSGKVDFGGIGFDLTATAAATMALGVDCLAGCQPVVQASGTSTGDVKPHIPTFQSNFRLDLEASAFVKAKLDFRVRLPRYRWTIFEASGGLAQTASFAPALAQALDGQYASSLKLKPFLKAATSVKIDSLASYIGASLVQLKVEPSLPLIAQSPNGSLRIVPAAVAASGPAAPGDTATFIVDLNSVNYLGTYAVAAVEIFRHKTNSAGNLLEPAPGPCREILPTAPGQSLFTCKTDFPETELGTHAYYAFVRPALFNVPITSVPLLLEIASDSRQPLDVFRLADWRFEQDLEGWTPGTSGAPGGPDWGRAMRLRQKGRGVVMLDGTGNPGRPNAWIFRTIQLPATAHTLRFEVAGHDQPGADARFVVRIVDGGASTTLLDTVIAGSGVPGTYNYVFRDLDITAFAGRTVTIYFEQDDNGFNGQHPGGHEQIYLDNISILR